MNIQTFDHTVVEPTVHNDNLFFSVVFSNPSDMSGNTHSIEVIARSEEHAEEAFYMLNPGMQVCQVTAIC